MCLMFGYFFNTHVPGLGEGHCAIVINAGRLSRVFLHHASHKRLRSLILKQYPDISFTKADHAITHSISKAIQHVLSNRSIALPDVRLDLDGLTPFQVQVLKQTARIKPGRTQTYAQIAASIHKPKAARAVGNALGKNPFPLFIPCHRVIRTNGAVGGFSVEAGTPLKTALLNMEKTTAST